MKLIFNVSFKKSGTTFLHDLIKINEKILPSIIAPAMKEWYVIPRVPPYASRNSFTFQYSLGERAEKHFEAETDPKHKEFLRRVANWPCGFHMTVPEIVSRIRYIMTPYDGHTVVISDPNFLDDIVRSSVHTKTNILKIINKIFDVEFITIHRNFAATAVSHYQMNYRKLQKHFEFRNLVIPSNHLIFYKLLKDCNIRPHQVVHFQELTTSPKKILEIMLSLDKEVNILTPNNTMKGEKITDKQFLLYEKNIIEYFSEYHCIDDAFQKEPVSYFEYIGQIKNIISKT